MMEGNIRKEYYRKIRMLLTSELISANKLEAVNSFAVTVVNYSFNITRAGQTRYKDQRVPANARPQI